MVFMFHVSIFLKKCVGGIRQTFAWNSIHHITNIVSWKDKTTVVLHVLVVSGLYENLRQ